MTNICANNNGKIPSVSSEYKEAYCSNNEKRRIKLTNYISLISLFSDIIFISYYSLIGFKDLLIPILILIFILPVYTLPIVLNKLRFHQAAKILLASFTSIITVLFCLYFFGREPGIHVFLLVFSIIPIFIWSFGQVVYHIVFIALNLLCFLYIELIGSPFQLYLEFPPEYIALTRGISILFSFLGAMVAIVIFHRLANKKEELLQEQNEKIEQQKFLLVKLNKELNNKVGELTYQQEELNNSNLIKSKIFSVIAHDLRSPLNSINGLLGIVLEEYKQLNKKQIEEYITSVHNASVNTFVLLENLLDWARLQSNKVKVIPEELNLHLVAEEAIINSKAFFKKKNISLSNKINLDLIVRTDKYMLSTVIRNLISNSIKFTPDGGKITVTADIIKNNIIEIKIIDTGIGMTKNEIDKLFDIEENFTKPGTNNEKGTGLGLLICKEFIEKNGGRINVSSIPNKGSIFSFTVNQ